MTELRQEHNPSGQPRPASEVEIRYGQGILESESAKWPRYIVVSTPRAYATARPYLSREPAGVAYADWLDWNHLRQVTNSLPDDAELVVGLGGGRALDASKQVALSNNLPLILVPTLISTGAIIHGVVGRWEGRRIVIKSDEFPWIDCERVLVEYDVVLQAPYHLNTAGLGDILCGYAGVAEWRRRSRLGIGPPVDEEAVARALGDYRSIAHRFPSTLDAHGHLTADSIHFIMSALQARDAKTLRASAAHAGEHGFWLAMELANDRGWIHGELVALGAVITAWKCGESPETLTGWLDQCRVRRRPSDIGIVQEELRKGLDYCPDFLANDINDWGTSSVLCQRGVSTAEFDRLWEFLERG